MIHPQISQICFHHSPKSKRVNELRIKLERWREKKLTHNEWNAIKMKKKIKTSEKIVTFIASEWAKKKPKISFNKSTSVQLIIFHAQRSDLYVWCAYVCTYFSCVVRFNILFFAFCSIASIYTIFCIHV